LRVGHISPVPVSGTVGVKDLQLSGLNDGRGWMPVVITSSVIVQVVLLFEVDANLVAAFVGKIPAN
jgi:hypothetical protein